MKSAYTYKQALKIIEKFMEDTNIRLFCTKYCVGYCCVSCYNSKNSCRKNEGRRISCSIFICRQLRELIFTPNQRKKWRFVAINVEDTVTKLKENDDLFEEDTCFDPDTRIIKQFQIDKNIINKIKFSTYEISNKVQDIVILMSISKGLKFSKKDLQIN